MAVSPAVLALRVPVGRVSACICSRSGEESNRRAYREYVTRVNGNDDRGGSFALPGLRVGVDICGGEDAYVFAVQNRHHKTLEELFQVFREEGDCEGVDGELCFVGGEAEGQPRRNSHRERLVELGGKSVNILHKGYGRGGRVGAEKGD